MTETADDLQTQDLGVQLTEADILEAMREIPGYLDITPRDFKEIYLLAFRHARKRLARRMTAAVLMTREVATVVEDLPVAEVAALMGSRGVSGVPVLTAAGRVSGVISEKDFLCLMRLDRPNFMAMVAACLKAQTCAALPLKDKKARDLMSSPAVVVRPETSLQEIAALLDAYHINRVPVVADGGQLVGIVSRGDLVRALTFGS